MQVNSLVCQVMTLCCTILDNYVPAEAIAPPFAPLLPQSLCMGLFAHVPWLSMSRCGKVDTSTFSVLAGSP